MKKIGINLLSIIIVIESIICCSCSSRDEDDLYFESNSCAIQQKVVPPLVIIAAIVYVVEVVTNVVDGKYNRLEIKQSDGTVIVKESCEGTFGTCSIPTTKKSTGVSVSSKIDSLQYSSYTKIDASIISCDLGIIYAINRDSVNAVNKFFYSDTINIQHELLIDNRELLSELKIRTPISVKGKYPVYQSKDYVFIILQEK